MTGKACLLAGISVLALTAPALAAETDPVKTATAIPEQLIVSITTLVVFVLLVLILAKTAWGPILRGLKSREDKIAGDIAAAEQNRLKSEALLKEYDAKIAAAEAEMRNMMVQATADAEKISVALKARTQQEIEEMREKASREIEAEKERAIADIHEEAVTLSTLLAEKILRRTINADDQRALVKSTLEQIAKSRNN